MILQSLLASRARAAWLLKQPSEDKAEQRRLRLRRAALGAAIRQERSRLRMVQRLFGGD